MTASSCKPQHGGYPKRDLALIQRQIIAHLYIRDISFSQDPNCHISAVKCLLRSISSAIMPSRLNPSFPGRNTGTDTPHLNYRSFDFSSAGKLLTPANSFQKPYHFLLLHSNTSTKCTFPWNKPDIAVDRHARNPDIPAIVEALNRHKTCGENYPGNRLPPTREL